MKINSFPNLKDVYLIKICSDKAIKSSVVNRIFPYLHGGSLKVKDVKGKFTRALCAFSICNQTRHDHFVDCLCFQTKSNFYNICDNKLSSFRKKSKISQSSFVRLKEYHVQHINVCWVF